MKNLSKAFLNIEKELNKSEMSQKYDVLVANNDLLIVKMDKTMYEDVHQNSLDEDNRRFVPDEVFETLEDAIEVVDFIIQSYDSEEGPFIFAIIRRSDDANIGYVQLVKIEDGWEIGYHIAKRFTGKGYATQAVRLFLEYLSFNTELGEIIGVALADNVASRKVLQKCGFELSYEGEGPYQGSNRNIIKTIKYLN